MRNFFAMKARLQKYPLGKRFTDACVLHKRRLYVFGAFSTLYTGALVKYRNHESKVIRIALAGSLSSMICEVLFHLADTVNIRAKLYNEKCSSIKVYKSIMQNEGINGLCKGISATFYGSIIAGLMYFALYKQFKEWLFKLGDGQLSPCFVFLISAFSAQSLTLLFYYPYNLFKCRLQTSNETYRYRNLVHAFEKEITENGIKSLYKGCSPFLVMFSTTIAIQFAVYESYLRYVSRWYSGNYQKHELAHIINASFIAGAIGHAVTNGLEVITVTKQCVPETSIKSIIHKERFGLLTKGIGARVWYQSTQSIVFFSAVAYIGKLYNVSIEE
ncbi:unnamed protein product [Moneuplotes crassus]|uniref:Mitochondrial carrier protein n=1 Tax=Euplotes crassus TaxID=5936 RepID=A0AAD1XJH2_EUPCR|nr:unnamed protein product [Moneuplotes crassus]